MRTKSASRAAVLMVLLVGVPSAARGQEWCEPIDWTPWAASVQPVKWKLNHRFWDYPNAPFPGSFCEQNGCTEASLRRAFEDVFAEIHNASGGKVRFLYDGPENNLEPGAELPGWVHVFPDEACDASGHPGALGWMFAWDALGSGGGDSAWLAICSHRPAPPYGVDFVPWIRSGGTEISLFAVALHEAMHILGLAHPDECGATNATIAEGYLDSPSQHLTSTDIHFLRVKFPNRTTDATAHYSTDALTWSVAGIAPPSEVAYQQTRFAATNNSTAYGVFLAWVDRIPFDRYLRVSLYDGTAGTWTYKLSLASSTFARYHPGIASASNSQVRVAHGTNYEDTTGLHHIRSRESTDGGTTWANPVAVTGTKTVMPGVSGTFDPATGQYIWMWRINGLGSTNGRIAYRIGSNSPVTNWSLQASDTPSIACGFASVGGGYNCLVAYSSTTDWGHLVKWTQCNVVGGQLNCLGIKTHPYYTVGSPSVAFSYDGFPYPWHIAVNQGGWTTYVWRKGQNYADNFQDQVSFAHGNKSILPAAAARLIDQYPLAPTSRRYVFVPSF